MTAPAPPAAVVSVPLSPLRALALAGELLAAASRSIEAALASRDTPRRRRGGDPLPGKRARRDEALCTLAHLMGNGASAERQARDLAHRLGKYRPMPVEASPERLLMREVVDSGLGIPRPDRLARIIRSRRAKIRLDTGAAPPS